MLFLLRLVTTFGEYIDIKQKGRATQLYKPEVAVGKKIERLQRNPRGNETYLEYLDMGNFKNTPNKTKKPNLLPDDDDEPTELSPSTLKVVKPTISPVKVKVEKMGNEVEVTKKEQKQEKHYSLSFQS